MIFIKHQPAIFLFKFIAIYLLMLLWMELFPFLFFLATPMACGSSQVRDQTHATAATQVAAVAMLDPTQENSKGVVFINFIFRLFIVRVKKYS